MSVAVVIRRYFDTKEVYYFVDSRCFLRVKAYRAKLVGPIHLGALENPPYFSQRTVQ